MQRETQARVKAEPIADGTGNRTYTVHVSSQGKVTFLNKATSGNGTCANSQLAIAGDA